MRIETAMRATPEGLKSSHVDTIALAVGARFAAPATTAALTPEEIMTGGRLPGKRVLVLGGDGVGVAAAVYLLGKGDFVITIAEESGRVGRDVSPFYLWRYMKLFKERGVSLLTRAKLVRYEAGKAFLSSAGQERIVEIDDAIVAFRESREELMEAFGGSAPEVFLLGDARRPRRLHNAIHEAFRMGMET